MNSANPFARPEPPAVDPIAGLQLSPQQTEAFHKVQVWLQQPCVSDGRVFRLFGYAGTGKTTLAKALAAKVPGKVCFGAYTGKAASVLNQKGCQGAATLHHLIYRPITDHDGQVTWIKNPESVLYSTSLLIVDEVSMVDQSLGEELLSFPCRILVLGDPEQLPPVRGAGFFTKAKPDILLTEIHRQAEGSPIIQLSHQVRQKRRLATGTYGDTKQAQSYVVNGQELDIASVISADQILVGKNETRRCFNTRLRELHGRRGAEPVVGDKVVCLKNDRSRGLYNGDVWFVAEVLPAKRDDRIRLALTQAPGSPKKTITVSAHRDLLLGQAEAKVAVQQHRDADLFEYGYALTVHKAQGSQWDNVVLFDEASGFGDDAHRWLYTGI